MTTTAQQTAKALLTFYADDVQKWTQGDYASAFDGFPVDPDDECATCWCALGAIRLIFSHDNDVNPQASALSAAIGMDVDHWNDRCKSFEEFIEDLKAIAEAQ